MFEKVLSKNERETLALLGQSGILQNSYMAGGTALALQIGHRFSYDFDFFTAKEFDENIMVQRIIKLLPDFRLEKKDWGTVLGYAGESRFSMFFYTYPLLFQTHGFSNVELADIKDIAAMKISAIADRGIKRDFIDLYFIVKVEKILTLTEVIKLYDKKFKILNQNKLHILKSLHYFKDAEEGEIPKMIKPVFWPEVKNFFKDEVRKLSKELL